MNPDTLADAQDILTVPEVASYLRVTTKTVYALVKRGDLRSFRVGRALRCRQEDVESFISRQSSAETSVRVEKEETR